LWRQEKSGKRGGNKGEGKGGRGDWAGHAFCASLRIRFEASQLKKRRRPEKRELKELRRAVPRKNHPSKIERLLHRGKLAQGGDQRRNRKRKKRRIAMTCDMYQARWQKRVPPDPTGLRMKNKTGKGPRRGGGGGGGGGGGVGGGGGGGGGGWGGGGGGVGGGGVVLFGRNRVL